MTVRDFTGLALRSIVGAPLVVCASVAACSSPPPLPARGFVDATLGPHRDSLNNNWCSYSSTNSVLQIGVGTGGSAGPVTQEDGSTQSNGKVAVACSVTGGFDITLTAALGGSLGGQISIRGHVDSSGGSNIIAALGVLGNSYQQADCTIAFTYGSPPMPVPVKQPVAGGRIWAHLKCPSAENLNGTLSFTDAMGMRMDVRETCDLEADFQFEDCS